MYSTKNQIQTINPLKNPPKPSFSVEFESRKRGQSRSPEPRCDEPARRFRRRIASAGRHRGEAGLEGRGRTSRARRRPGRARQGRWRRAGRGRGAAARTSCGRAPTGPETASPGKGRSSGSPAPAEAPPWLRNECSGTDFGGKGRGWVLVMYLWVHVYFIIFDICIPTVSSIIILNTVYFYTRLLSIILSI